MSYPPEKSICIIDDDADVRDSVRALLESYGFRTISFSSAGEFLSASPAADIGCFLLDLHMPGMTGLEFLEHLRNTGIQTPAIMVTANGNKLSSRFARAGALAVLRKPIGDEELLQWVRKALAPTDGASRP